MKLDLNSIIEMWKQDCVIPEFNLDDTSRRIPNLHAKYLEILSVTKLTLKKEELNQKTLLKDKWLYYNGKMSKADIEAKGWEFDPFDGLKVLKGDMNHYYESDTDIQKSEEKITYLKTVISTLEEIMGNLKWRQSTIKSIIDWRKFEAGG